MKKLLYLNKQWLEKEYLQKGLSSRKIAKSLGMSKATILRQLKRFDIPRHSHGHPRGKMKPDIKLICLECGKEFYVDNHDENRRKFCSHKCKDFFHSYHPKSKPSPVSNNNVSPVSNNNESKDSLEAMLSIISQSLLSYEASPGISATAKVRLLIISKSVLV